ncbi:hypothetical protein ACLEIY_18200 [Acetobacter tropicalis]|uniref:Uncharacterized protein n=1 Tax=Acetobacter tropicalis NBRC 101654 TaxID=749388 RepID=F7VIW5_9PROT|nr:hypothetical protein [Acetobacter tropicalis]GAA10310.1 hypothetical protein ATPR_3314 [Acetobacter tropicalis NBRC 101654]
MFNRAMTATAHFLLTHVFGGRPDLSKSAGDWTCEIDEYPNAAELSDAYLKELMETREQGFETLQKPLLPPSVGLGWFIIAGVVSFTASHSGAQFVGPIANRLGQASALGLVGMGAFIFFEMWKCLPGWLPNYGLNEPEIKLENFWMALLKQEKLDDKHATTEVSAFIRQQYYERSIAAIKNANGRRAVMRWITIAQIVGLFATFLMGWSLFTYENAYPECVFKHQLDPKNPNDMALDAHCHAVMARTLTKN